MTSFFFNESDRAAGALVGGKGANLIALHGGKFPVPSGFVVSAEAYRQFLSRASWLPNAVAELDFERPEVLCEQCTAIRTKLTRQPLSSALQYHIRAAVDKLQSHDSSVQAFAVRSSSTFEDLAQAAFAGQHETYLNVRGNPQVIDRIRDCFASLWEHRAAAYRHQHGFSQTAAAMAVVVQQQIECDAAGVAFSIDPMAGRMDRMIINANFGIGESVVSGDGEIDQFTIEKTTLNIIDRRVGHKTNCVVVAPEGNVESRPVSAELSDRPCLTDEQIGELSTLLKRIEKHFGWPQDVEWGIAHGRVHLLQSRPVTTIAPDWTRDESAERFPNPMTPLSWDFINVAFQASLTHSFELMGLPPLKGDWFRVFDHYIYGDQNAVQLVGMFRPIKATNAAELLAELPVLRQRFAWVMDLPVNWARDLDRYLIRLGRLDARSEPTTIKQAWRMITDVLDIATDYFRPNIAISMTQAALHRLLHNLIALVAPRERTLGILDGLLSGCQTKTAIVNREMHELAMHVGQMQTLRDDLAERGGRAFFDAGRLRAYPEFAVRFDRFLEDHGHREVDIDYSVPTWAGQPWVVLDSILLMLRGSTDDPSEAMRLQRVRYAQTEQQFMAAVPEELRFFFRELIGLTRTYTLLDDLEHYQTTRMNPLAYRAALAMGKQLQKLGVLDEPADVFFLNKSDVETLATQSTTDVIVRCRQKAIDAKGSHQAAFAHPPAWTRRLASTVTDSSDEVLHGLPGSAGCATGPCFIVRGPEDFGRFPRGAVLVARTTNPAWTPLFYAACAVLTESGGPLSHGAVTAREMNLPAVMSVRGIMTLVHEGQVVNVNGANGTVELVE